MSKPAELVRAELVDMFAQRYHVVPSAILNEDVSIIRRLRILDAASCPKNCGRVAHPGRDC